MAEYDKLAKLYVKRRTDTSRFDYNRDIEVPALIKMIGDVKGKIILDLGCGFGDHAKKLSQQNFKRLVGLDMSKELVNFANGLQIPHASFYVGDMRKKLQHKNSSFDIVYSSLAIHYIKNLNPLFKDVNRVLKKGGIFCFSTGHPIFNLMNQQDNHLVGITMLPDDKRIIFGNYFDESPKPNDLGSLGKVKLCNFTFETLIKAGLNNGFELIDYADAKPTKISQKYDPQKYRVATTLPTFILFKFQKK
jgi:SAM-dependent methyltransferase